MDAFWIVLTGNEFGSSPLEDAKCHLAVEEAYIEFATLIESEEHEVVTLYEFVPTELRFKQVDCFIEGL